MNWSRRGISCLEIPEQTGYICSEFWIRGIFFYIKVDDLVASFQGNPRTRSLPRTACNTVLDFCSGVRAVTV